METQGRAVTIYVRQDDGSYKLDLEALGKILNQEGVGDLPVMVISVAGAMREGKSFLLNLFIKYLESEQNDEWLADDSKLKGFSWRGGAERDTLGILMWTKPYHIDDEKGQKVAVLLMDTQGAFDNEHTMAQSTRIITMSLMMCSLQIYNVMQTLRADKLEFFSLFLEHAKMVKSETKENVFQSLMFLVRDWPHQEDHDFGLDGGTAHIKKQLQRFSKKAKIGKKDFKDIFNHYEGFLLPHPGEKVAEQRMGSKPFEGKTSDMNEDFTKYIGRLVRHLFRKDHIVKKAITGADVNGRTLLAFAENIGKLLENEDMPAPKDLVEAQIQAHCSSILDEFTRKFRDKVNQFLPPDQFVDDEALENDGSTALAATMEEFEKRQIYGGEEAKTGCRTKLQANLSHAFEEAKIRNRDTRNTYRKKYEDFFVKEEEMMEKKLRQTFDKRCVLDEEIQNACKVSSEELQRKLLDQNFEAKCFDDEFVKKIENLGKKLCNSLQEKNKSELAVASSKSSAKEAELAHLAREMITEELGARICSTKSEVNRVVEGVKLQVWKKWEEQLPDYPDFVLDKYKKSLQRDLEQLLPFAEGQNADNKEKFSKETAWELSEIGRKYNAEMARRVGKKAHDKETLEEFHLESVEQARTALEQKDIGANLKQACLEKIETELRKELGKIEKRNEDKTDSFETTCELQKTTCLDAAKDRIKEKCCDKVLSEDEISSIHGEVTREARDAFQKQEELGPKSVYEKCAAELNRELGKLLSVAKDMNKDFEKSFLLTKTAEMKTAKKDYKRAMLEVTSSDEAVEKSTLKDFHTKISAETIKAFMSRLGKLPPNVENECRAMLDDTLKHAFSDIQRENEQKKRDCELKAKQILADCLEVYNAEMNGVTKGNILDQDEMKSNHEAASAKARDKLSAQKVGLPDSITKDMEDSLTQSISDRHVYFKQDNERRKAWAEKEVSDRMLKLKKLYKDEVNYLNEGRPWSEVDLRRHHRTALEKVEAKAREARSGEIQQLSLDEIEESKATWWMETENDNNAKTNSFDTKCREVKQRAKQAYKDEMSRKGMFLTEKSLQEAGERARQSAFDIFWKSGLKGPDETINMFGEELRKDLNDEFDIIKTDNKDKQVTMQKKASDVVEAAKDKYKGQMEEAFMAKATMSEEDLQATHSAIVRVIVRDEISCKGLHSSFEDEARREFETKAKEEFSTFAARNRRAKVEQDNSIKDYIRKDCVDSYESAMRELCGVKLRASEVQSHHREAMQSAFNKFKDYNKIWNRDNEGEYRSLLDNLCLQSKAGFIAEGKRNEAEMEKSVQALVSQAKSKYETEMTKDCGSLEQDLTSLSEIQQRAKEHAIALIKNSTADQQVRDAALRTFENEAGSIYSRVKSCNDVRLRDADSVIATIRKEAGDHYTTTMETHIRRNCCHDLQAKHEEVERELLRRDANVKGVNKGGRAFTEFKEERTNILARLFNKCQRTNSATQGERSEKYMRMVSDAFQRYKADAEQQWRESDHKKWGADGKIKNFQKHHKDIKFAHVNKLKKNLPPNNCPSCTTCEASYAAKLENQINDFKSRVVAQIKSGSGCVMQ